MTVDEIIAGIEIGYGSDDCYWGAIEKAVGLLKLVKETPDKLQGADRKQIDEYFGLAETPEVPALPEQPTHQVYKI